MARTGASPRSFIFPHSLIPAKLYPPLFKRVKEKIKEGKFHPVGGSWVENDSNMPSGEALARQFILGQRYFESRFGVRCKTAWLPDSFGLTGALPQLIRLADMDYFFTQKLSWWVTLSHGELICNLIGNLGSGACCGFVDPYGCGRFAPWVVIDAGTTCECSLLDRCIEEKRI